MINSRSQYVSVRSANNVSVDLGCNLSQLVLALLCFVVASYVYIRRDTSGFLTSISSETTAEVYFISNGNATVFITVEMMCEADFNGTIKVIFQFHMRVFLCCGKNENSVILQTENLIKYECLKLILLFRRQTEMSSAIILQSSDLGNRYKLKNVGTLTN